jgi:Fe-Mn family superoxide dismutase
MDLSPPKLPYSFRALEPAMSRETLWFHFARHQRTCFEPAVAIIKGTELERLDLEQVVARASCLKSQRELFQHAAGLWNHQIFWQSMRPGGGGVPDGQIGQLIRRRFGSYEAFVREFMCASADCHGSGWIWLSYQEGEVRIAVTANSDSPLLTGQVTLLGLDLWEHAFYLDHQNRRAEYVRTFLEDLVNWDFANRNLEAAQRS